MKQNKKYLVVFFFIILLIGILSVSALADDYSTNGLDPVLLPVGDDLKASGFEIGVGTGINGRSWYAWSDTSDVYISLCGQGNQEKYIVASSSTPTFTIYLWNAWTNAVSSSSSPSIDNNTRLYYSSSVLTTSTANCAWYSNITDPLTALEYMSDTISGGSSSNLYDLDYSLPPGNVAFVELTSDSSDLILTTDMPSLSNLFGEAWSNVSQMYGYSNSLPSSGTSFNTSGLATIDWSKAAPFNVLGQSKNAAKILSVSNNSTYLVIYNPLYFYVRDGGNGAESSFLDNGYIRIRLNDVSNVKVFSLISSAQIGPNASTEDAISSTVTSSGVTQTVDPDTGLPIWTDSDGNVVDAPGIGQGNIASSGTTTFSILQQIADTISNFFQGSVGAISNLIDNGSSFMSKLGTLYSWLPPPVYAVLTSALILVITIGVIKVFL